MKDVKNHILEMIDAIDDESFLEAVYDILQSKQLQKKGSIWNSLTKEQQEEVLKASNETSQPEKQVSHEDMIERNRKWLEW